MICVDARNEIFEHIELYGSPAMFTNARVDRPTVPEGLFCYDIRGSDDDPGALCMIENHVCVNHAGTVIGTVDYLLGKDGYKVIGEGINFLGDEITLDEFCGRYGVEIGEPKKGVLDALRENKEKAAKQPVKPKTNSEQSR
jgi:hypothetical protein